MTKAIAFNVKSEKVGGAILEMLDHRALMRRELASPPIRPFGPAQFYAVVEIHEIHVAAIDVVQSAEDPAIGIADIEHELAAGIVAVQVPVRPARR